jgi:hypothetical protein
MVRRLTLAALVLTALTLGAAPALAQTAGGDGDPVVVFTGTISVAQDQTVSDAIIFDGDATIAGHATGNVIAFHGDVVVTGSIDENVISLTGRVTLGAGANVEGDVVSRLRPVIDPSATYGGVVRRPNWNNDWSDVRLFGRIVWWIGATVSSFLLGLFLILFAPRAADAVALAGTERTGPSFGWGALAFFAVPVAAAILLGTVVGAPLGLGVMLALALLYWVGYVAAAYVLGRRLGGPDRSRILAFTIGWAILRGLAVIPILAGLTWFVAALFGLGALILAARPSARPAASPPAPATVAATGSDAGGAIPPPPPIPPAG